MNNKNYSLNTIITFLLLNGSDNIELIEDIGEIMNDSTLTEDEKIGAANFVLRKAGLIDDERLRADIIEEVLTNHKQPKPEPTDFIVNRVTLTILNGHVTVDVPLN